MHVWLRFNFTDFFIYVENVVDGDDYQHGGDRRTADKLCVLRQHPNYDENRRMFAVEWSGNKTMKVRPCNGLL